MVKYGPVQYMAPYMRGMGASASLQAQVHGNPWQLPCYRRFGNGHPAASRHALWTNHVTTRSTGRQPPARSAAVDRSLVYDAPLSSSEEVEKPLSYENYYEDEPLR